MHLVISRARSAAAKVGRYHVRRARLSEDVWPAIRDRYAAGESLRQLSRTYGVSYEAIRQIVARARIET